MNIQNIYIYIYTYNSFAPGGEDRGAAQPARPRCAGLGGFPFVIKKRVPFTTVYFTLEQTIPFMITSCSLDLYITI